MQSYFIEYLNHVLKSFMENGLLLSKRIECEVLGTLILCIENDLGLKKMLKMWTLEIL